MIHLYFHGGSSNHGCEAIVRSTLGILGQDAVLHTSNIASDRAYGLDRVTTLREDVTRPLARKSLPFLLFALHHKLTGSDYLYTRFAHNAFFSDIRRGDVCLSIGGDNYCYGGQDILAHYNKVLHKKGAKTVLWGCSVEPELTLDPAIAKDLARYDLITARETISYEALKAVNPNTILVADPAFTLVRRDLPLPTGWVDGKMVGINASPLILERGDGQLVMEAYRNLIRRILDTTDLGVVLVPHVVTIPVGDFQPLQRLLEDFRSTGRVILLGDHNCMELKGYIARCRMFIGARTHATIAAYSQCVPTLVLGYSVKSRGIARDLFGTEENYVISVQGMTDPNALAEGFDWLKDREQEIRTYLEQQIPKYKSGAHGAVDVLKIIGCNYVKA